MRLTEEQSQIVADNHLLIYWIAHILQLDLQEFYDLLAIELCYTVIKHNPDRGSLANYYKLRAEGMVYKEYRKSQSQKRLHEDITYIENAHHILDPNNIGTMMEFKDFMDCPDAKMLQMKYEGYSQQEIAKEIGVSQSYVSKILKKFRDDYNEANG